MRNDFNRNLGLWEGFIPLYSFLSFYSSFSSRNLFTDYITIERSVICELSTFKTQITKNNPINLFFTSLLRSFSDAPSPSPLPPSHILIPPTVPLPLQVSAFSPFLLPHH